MNWLNGLFKNQKGVFLVFTAVLLPIIFACAGLAMDLGNAFAHKSKLQNAADAAVLVYGRFDYGNNDNKPENAELYMKANGKAGMIDKVTRRTLNGSGDTTTVLLSLFASEDVPTTFMRMFGFDKVPVSVVATCKVKRKDIDSGVFGYSFIVGDNRTASQITGSPWDSNWDGPFQFYNNRQKIIGKFHSNGAIQIVNNIDGDHKINGIRNVFIDESSHFSTSIKSDMELWFNKSTLNKWEYADLKSKTTLHEHDVPLDPTNLAETDWYHMARFGYETDGVNGKTWGEDILASEHYKPEIDISLEKDNKKTEAIYEYLEELKQKYSIKTNQLYNNNGVYFVTDGEYAQNRNNYVSYTINGPVNYKIIVIDGDLTVNPGGIDHEADHVVIMSLHGNIYLQDNDKTSLNALIYAPNGKIVYNGSENFTGSMVAKQIRLQKSNVTYTWSDFGFAGGNGSGSSGDDGGDSITKVTLHADQDSNYGNESTLWSNQQQTTK